MSSPQAVVMALGDSRRDRRGPTVDAVQRSNLKCVPSRKRKPYRWWTLIALIYAE